MAKLQGVTTVDMVNGEITKIAYDGGEYVKVANEFKDARTGDVFMDVHTGEYYEIAIRERDYFGVPHPVRFVTDGGTDDGYMRECNVHPLFRKVSALSAESTSIIADVSEKVEAVEKDVTSLEQRVIALEGSKPTQELAKGMRVKALANGEFDDIKKGDYGVISGLDCGDGERDPYGIRVDIVGDHDYFRPQDLEIVAEDDEGKEALKVGDYATVIPSSAYVLFKFKVGETGKITKFRSDGYVYIKNEKRGEELMAPSQIRKATEEEVAKATTPPKPTTGDIVVITDNTNSSRNKVGDIGKVGECSVSTAVVVVPSNPKTRGANGNNTKYTEMRLATDAEKAEYEAAVKQADVSEVFTKVGRKPNEYRKGDIVKVVEEGSHEFNSEDIVEIVAFDGMRLNKIKGKRLAGNTDSRPYLYEREITPVVFAEDRKDNSKGAA